MIRVDQHVGENRKDYLLRVIVTYLRDCGYAGEETIIFDDAECDGYCLADDIVSEFESQTLNFNED